MKIILTFLILLSLFAFIVPSSPSILANSNDDLNQWRNQIISWVDNSGVLNSFPAVHQDVRWSGSSWQVSATNRYDSEGEVAYALLYQYRMTSITSYKERALTLLKDAWTKSSQVNGWSGWFATGYSSWGTCYTEDNGKQLQFIAYAVELTGDSELRGRLEACADFWVNMIPSDGGVGVGINSIRLGNWLSPPVGMCVNHIGMLLAGMCRADQVIGKQTYRDACIRLGNWLVSHQLSDGSWHVPDTSEDFMCNGGNGLEVYGATNALLGLSLLYNTAGQLVFKNSADKAFNWLYGIATQADTLYHLGKLCVEPNLGLHYGVPTYSVYNVVYNYGHLAFVGYYSNCNQDPRALELADADFSFRGTVMTMHGPVTCEGGHVSEWDLANNQRGTFSDHEGEVYGNIIYTGWSNTLCAAGIAQRQLLSAPPGTGAIHVIVSNNTTPVFFEAWIDSQTSYQATGEYTFTEVAVGSHVVFVVYNSEQRSGGVSVSPNQVAEISFDFGEQSPPLWDWKIVFVGSAITMVVGLVFVGRHLSLKQMRRSRRRRGS